MKVLSNKRSNSKYVIIAQFYMFFNFKNKWSQLKLIWILNIIKVFI